MNNMIIPNSTRNDSIWLCKIRDLIITEYKIIFENINLDTLSNYNPNYFVNRVEDLENEMLNFSWDSSDYKALKFVALLKYTSTMWTENIFGPSNISNKKIIQTNISSKEELLQDKDKDAKRAKLVGYMKDWSFWGGAIFSDACGGFSGTGAFMTVWELLQRSGLTDSYLWNVAKQIYP